MSAKMKSITLATWETMLRDEKGGLAGPPGKMTRKWRVLKVSNSIEYHPDQELDKNTVEALCNAPSWSVTINPNA
jgi:hypothetical protein